MQPSKGLDGVTMIRTEKMRQRAQSFILLLPVLVFATACKHQDGFVGTWKTPAPAQGSDATMTFNPDHTMSFVATNGPSQTPYKLTGIGNWSSKDKMLTVIPLSMQLDGLSPMQKAKLMPYINAQLKVAQTGPVVWKGNDEFILTKNRIVQDFKRAK